MKRLFLILLKKHALVLRGTRNFSHFLGRGYEE